MLAAETLTRFHRDGWAPLGRVLSDEVWPLCAIAPTS
jgi:hypothetical protein